MFFVLIFGSTYQDLVNFGRPKADCLGGVSGMAEPSQEGSRVKGQGLCEETEGIAGPALTTLWIITPMDHLVTSDYYPPFSDCISI